MAAYRGFEIVIDKRARQRPASHADQGEKPGKSMMKIFLAGKLALFLLMHLAGI